MDASEFCRRFTSLVRDERNFRVVFFLGAGTSVSSGIPDAAELVRKWLPRLADFKTGSIARWEEWADRVYPEWRVHPAHQYGRVFEELFPNAHVRQQEIERLTRDRRPSFGYSVLARLMSHPQFGNRCNVALTTNFDDLLQDALFLYAQTKPLTIPHDLLANFARASAIRPLVVKLHGDARLAPRNTPSETEFVSQETTAAVKRLLEGSCLVFLGYGGGDRSIANLLTNLSADSLPWGVFWINSQPAHQQTKNWLDERDAVWVPHSDFDTLMLLLWKQFELGHPDFSFLHNVSSDYQEAFATLDARLMNPTHQGSQDLRAAALQARNELESTVADHEAHSLAQTNPAKAEEAYSAKLQAPSTNAYLLSNYALFLKTIRKDYDRAEQYFIRALEVNPNLPDTLSNYAYFQSSIRQNHELADTLYKRAIAIRPSATLLGNYAIFLENQLHNFGGAEQYYLRAIELEPDDAHTLSNYGAFLWRSKRDPQEAARILKKAVMSDPNHSRALGNYAALMQEVFKDNDQAEEYHKRATEADPRYGVNLANYAYFLESVRHDYDQAESHYLRAIETNGQDAFALRRYALFLQHARANMDGAEAAFQKALAADPNNADALHDYALFLQTVRHDHDRAGHFYEQALRGKPEREGAHGSTVIYRRPE